MIYSTILHKAMHYLLFLSKEVYRFLNNIALVCKSAHTIDKKYALVWAYSKLTMIAWFFPIKPTKITFFGYVVEGFSYTNIRFLFEEIFLKNEYFFTTNTDTPIIFDCGANIGMATIFFKWIFPDATVYAFEPDPKTYTLLEKNIKNNHLQNVYTYNVALTYTEGAIDFFINENNPGSLMMSVHKDRMSKNSISIPGIKLSQFIKDVSLQKIDFIKMDIEGSEFDVVTDLSEAEKITCIDSWAIEYHHHLEKYKTNLGSFLALFEKYNFDYQLDARILPHAHAHDLFQDVLIRVYKKITV